MVIELDNNTQMDKEIIEAHCLCGHGCVNVTYLFLKENYSNVPPIRRVKEVIRNCVTCLKRNKNKKFEITPITRNLPFQMIRIDTMGPLPKTKNGNRFILLATDYATNWIEGRAVRNKTTNSVARFIIEEVISRHGPPGEIRSDLGTEYNSKVIKEIAQKWGIKMRYTAPYAPYSNGKAERTNSTMVNKLSKLIEHNEDWDEIFDIAMFSFRISPAEKSKKSPFELLYGRTPFINQGDAYKNKEFVRGTMEDCRKSMDEIIENRNMKYKEQIERINKNARRAAVDDLLEGDIVLYIQRHGDSKFSNKWIGPFIIVKLMGNGTVFIKSLETGITFKAARKDVKFYNPKKTKDVESALELKREDNKVEEGGMLPDRQTFIIKKFN